MAQQAAIDIVMRLHDRASRGVQRALRRINSSIQRTARLVFSLKGAFAALGAGLVAKSFLDTATRFEKFELQLKTIEGSAEAARRSLDWITDFTARTPYELTEVTAAFVKLRAYGIDPTSGTLRTLGDTAAAMGKRLDQAVEAFADASQGEFERLKEFGVKARSTADEVTFAWTDAMGRMREDTVAKRADIIRETLSMIWNERYAGGMEELSTSWAGMWSNLMDRLTLFKRKVMESGPFQVLKAGLADLLEAIDGFAADGTLDRWAVRTAEAVVDAFEVMIRAADAFGRTMNVLQGSFGVLAKEFYNASAFYAQRQLNLVNDRLNSLENPGILDPMQLLNTKLGINDEEIAALRKRRAELEQEVFGYVNKMQEWDQWIQGKADAYVARSSWLPAALEKLDELRARVGAGAVEEDRLKALMASEQEWGASFADLKRGLNEPPTPDAHWMWIDPTESAERWGELWAEKAWNARARAMSQLTESGGIATQRDLDALIASEQEWADSIALIPKRLAEVEQAHSEMARVVTNLYADLAAGVGDAFADMLLEGRSFADRMKALFRDITRSAISYFVSLGFTSLFPMPVPAMASGGIVTRPTLALIGESGPEAVVPLGRLGRDAGAGKTEVNVTNRVVVYSAMSDTDRAELLSAVDMTTRAAVQEALATDPGVRRRVRRLGRR